MPSKDFIVKLAGDSKSYQSAMGQAGKALDQFQKQNMSTAAAMKTVTTTLSKYISVAALAKGAVDAFNATIRGSNELTDRFNGSMEAAKSAVSTFFSSLATGDFSQFDAGIDNLIRKAREAYDALDRLGNASMSWGYFQTARMADMTELQAIVNDKSLPMEQRKQAAAQMASIQQELRGYAQGYEQRALEAMAREMTAATKIDWTDVTREDLEKVLRLDLMDIEMSEAEKNRLAAQYKEYTQRLKELTPIRGAVVNGAKSKEYIEDERRYNAEAQAIAKDYQDAILYHAVLVRKSDEWLQNLIQLVQQADAAAKAMKRVDSAVLSAQNLDAAGSTGTPKATGKTAAAPKTNYMSSLEIERMMYQGRIQLAEKFSDEWVALQQGLREVEYQMEVEKLTSTIQNEDDLAAALKLAEQVKQKDLYDIEMEGYAARLALAEEFSQDEENAINNTKALTDHIDTVRTLSSAFAQLGGAMAGTGNKAAASAGAILQAVNQALPALQTLFTSASSAAVAEGMAETPTAVGKIAAAISLSATILSTISTLKSIQTYAEGGIVPGHDWNDGITARVSSGEMVINEADQKRLYDSIHSGNLGGGGGGPAVITGEQIVLAVNNYGRRTNQGELVFAGR